MADKKILVVDDEIHIVQVVAIKLRNNGYQVYTAENGAEALDLAGKERPDVIISDYQMPVMTGLELVENLRKKSETAEIPVVMLTARGFAIDDQQRESLKIAACLSKPFSPREVLQCIEEVIGHSAAA
ncbi:MAG: response regulator [Sedimentisphaerales bacterium]|nr:response regulator [Sedimentisphaerales bacterium]